MKNWTVLSFLTFVISFANAQVSGNGIAEYSAQGNLVILRIIPGDKVTKLFIVGKKAAELDLKKDAKVLSVFLKSDDHLEELRINNRGDYYEVHGLRKRETPYELSVTTAVKGKKEDVTFKINMQKP